MGSVRFGLRPAGRPTKLARFMPNPLSLDRVLVTVTGPDRTGVTATLTGILAEQGASLFDIEQVVVQGQLTLCLLVGIPGNRDVLKELLFTAKQLGMDLDFKPVPAVAASVPPRPAEGQRYVITAIG